MIIMNLKKFLGIQSTQEKVEDYRKLKGQLANLETLGQELSDKFSIQKSVIDGVDGLPEEKKSEVFEKYRGFLKEHQKEVSSAVNERNKILKSLLFGQPCWHGADGRLSSIRQRNS